MAWLKNTVITFLPALLAGWGVMAAFAAPLQAKEAPRRISLPTVKITIDVNDVPICKYLEEPLRTFLIGMNRYRPASKQDASSHVFLVRCARNGITAEWQIVSGNDESPRTVAYTPILRPERGQTPESMAYVLVKQTMDALPWDGEIFSFKKISQKKLKYLSTMDASGSFTGEISTGFAADLKIGHCAPTEVVAFTGSKQTPDLIGYGIILSAKRSAGKAEFVLTKGRPKFARVFYRFVYGGAVPSWMEPQIAACKADVGQSDDSALDLSSIDGMDVGGQSLIELNRITQKGGFLVGQMKTNNGLESKLAVAAHVTNKIEFGSWASVEMRAFRTLKAAAYTTADERFSIRDKPEGTLAEGYGMIRYSNRYVTIDGGPGLLIDKFNFPYLSEYGSEEERKADTSIRRSTLRPAGSMNILYEWSDYWLELKLNGSFSRISSTLAMESNFNIILTNTWYAGFGAYSLTLKDTAFGEPGGSFFGVGGHIGISLKRRTE